MAAGSTVSGIQVLKDAPTPENPNKQIPHNPLINAVRTAGVWLVRVTACVQGAIMAVSMIFPHLPSRAARLEKVLHAWRQLSLHEDQISYDHSTYLSESEHAYRSQPNTSSMLTYSTRWVAIELDHHLIIYFKLYIHIYSCIVKAHFVKLKEWYCAIFLIEMNNNIQTFRTRNFFFFLFNHFI